VSGFALVGGLASGVGLFLLGMGLMTDGLKLAAGPALERTLARSTKTRLRGLASGALVTLLVQSSSAVTVATIGFVNAGLLTLGQSLWVLFGANVGTTMTGWLVALVGLKFDIALLALPLIGLGMLLRLTGEGSRRGALGTAVAGFGVLFLGIDLRMARAAAAGAGGDRAALARDERIVDRLNLAIADFIARLSRATLSQDSAARLPQILRVARYYETAADQAQEAAAAAAESEAGDFPAGHEDFRRQAEALFARCDPAAPPASPAEIDAALDGFEADYQELKAELLEAGAQDRLTVADMDARLRAASALRRAAQQIAKAARMLAGGAVPAHDPAPAMEKAERNGPH
jgi:Na+/phosphate symporter